MTEHTQEPMIPLKQAVEEVRTMGRCLAELYYFFAKNLVEKFGDEGEELVHKVIKEYGEHRGSQVRKKIEAMGLPLTPENYRLVPDLPRIGWEAELVESNSRCQHSKVKVCPFATAWKDIGCEEIASIYCEIDPAKFRAYNPKIKFRRDCSLLERGSTVCDMIAELEE